MHCLRFNISRIIRQGKYVTEKYPNMTRYYTNQRQSSSDHQNKTKSSDSQSSQIMLRGPFENIENKDRDSYLQMVTIFENRDVHRRNHVEFIYAALKNMQEFGVHRDIEVYKALINVMPKGKFIPTNMFQAEFQHYPKQQQCILDLLEQMEDNGNTNLI